MQPPPIGQAEIEQRIGPHLDELLTLWWAEQGAAKVRDLELMAKVLPFPRDEALRVLDLCSGPGDVGRAVRRKYPNAEIDCVDRDPFLTAICAGVNRRDDIPGKVLIRDLEAKDWYAGLLPSYDVVAIANALHWFSTERAQSLIRDVNGLLRQGGVFVFAEPAVAEAPFATGFRQWTATQPQRYSRENWQRFWSRANAVLGYDHIKLLGSRTAQEDDDELSATGWLDLVQNAGFSHADVLLRDADEVVVAAVKS